MAAAGATSAAGIMPQPPHTRQGSITLAPPPQVGQYPGHATQPNTQVTSTSSRGSVHSGIFPGAPPGPLTSAATSTTSSANTSFTNISSRASVAGANARGAASSEPSSGKSTGTGRDSFVSESGGGKIRADSLVEVLDEGQWKRAFVRKKRHDGTYKVP
jgi:hypothetical protein